MVKYRVAILLVLLLSGLFAAEGHAADAAKRAELAKTVDSVIRPLLKKHDIPGMAIAVTVGGEHFFFNFGVLAKDSQQPVTQTTLFEIGSVSKTFTAALAAYAQRLGKISLTEKVSAYLPVLRGSAFDQIRLLNLATHTSGGLPLQVPNNVTSEKQLLDYFKSWKNTHAPGTHRNYSNISVGLLGMLTAQRLGMQFEDAVAAHLFTPLGLGHTFYTVPPKAAKTYAQGYTNAGKPARMAPGLLSLEAYGIKSCSQDLLRWLEANMDMAALPDTLTQALRDMRGGYATFGDMTQGLIWEQYQWPATLQQLLAGNSSEMVLGTPKAEQLTPQRPRRDDMLVNKTGSTNGFGTYVLFVPVRKTGVVLLANKNYPSEARITAGLEILTALQALAPL